jgi:1-acyl-sn-glycerol-3-phosphate acyltransferase
MIAKAVKEEHPRPRPVSITVEHFFRGYPGFAMLLPKVGAVPAHPANVHRLLFDEGKLVLVFPEGRKGTEKLYRDRYRLRRFGRGGFVEAAMRARAPIVPIAVVGAEEAAPIFAHV